MKDRVLLGVGRRTIPIPHFVWPRLFAFNAGKVRESIKFMTADHHRVRDFAVTELARTGKPLSPDVIAERLALPPARIKEMLDQMERRMMFLVRNNDAHITWAYPVTADQTPHHARFDTGEEAYSP